MLHKTMLMMQDLFFFTDKVHSLKEELSTEKLKVLWIYFFFKNFFDKHAKDVKQQNIFRLTHKFNQMPEFINTKRS